MDLSEESQNIKGYHVKHGDINLFIKLFKEGLTLKKMSEITGFGSDTISKHLKNKGYYFSSRKKFFGNEKDIIKFYNKSKNAKKTSEKFGCSTNVVRRIIKENNLHTYKSNYTLDENYFKVIDTHDKAYILGLIYADGNVTSTNGSYSFRISLKNEDAYILDKLNDMFRSNRPLYTKDNCSVLQITNKTFFINLINQKVYENKTFKIRFPKSIPKKFLFSFIRGYFDGDGYFYINKSRKIWRGTWAVCSNDLFIKDLYDMLKSFNFSPKIYKNKTHNISELRIMKADEIIKLFQLIYFNSNNLFLIRKKNKIESFYFHYIKNKKNKYKNKHQIIKFYNEGKNGNFISKKLEISSYTVYKVIKEHKKNVSNL